MNETIYAKPGTPEQYVDLRNKPTCPDGFIEMQNERPNIDYIAYPDGTWQPSQDQILNSLKQERNHHRQQGLNYQGYQVEAKESDWNNIVTIVSGYSEGIRADNTPVYFKIAPMQYLTLTGKPETVALAAAMDIYVQTLFNIEAKLGQEVITLTTEQLKAFDVKQRFQEELSLFLANAPTHP